MKLQTSCKNTSEFIENVTFQQPRSFLHYTDLARAVSLE